VHLGANLPCPQLVGVSEFYFLGSSSFSSYVATHVSARGHYMVTRFAKEN
jgi:hypothetical protein